jgi:ceramide glucosyltransferase
MTGGFLFWAAAIWWAATMFVQWLSAAVARRRRPSMLSRHVPANFSVVAPLTGSRDASPAYIASLRDLSQAGAEILICAVDPRDEAITRARAYWPDAPILVGADRTFNPKLNNVRKGLEAATRPVVALCDAGITLTAGQLLSAAAQLSDRVGLILALKAGTAPGNFAGEMECAYINGHQARFLLAADRLGMPVASGGITILSHDTLQQIGGHLGFLHYIADDYSVVRAVRAQPGCTTWLANFMPHLPVGERRWADVWRRQVRWGSTRFNLPLEVKALVLFEPTIGWLVGGMAGLVALLASGAGLPIVILAVAMHTMVWFAAEAWFLAGYGLPFGPRAWAAALLREALVPALAAKAWLGRHSIDWRGTDLAAGWRPPRDGVERKSV